jgi:hypothetical protein
MDKRTNIQYLPRISHTNSQLYTVSLNIVLNFSYSSRENISCHRIGTIDCSKTAAAVVPQNSASLKFPSYSSVRLYTGLYVPEKKLRVRART